jgi:FkbM family methyltransferase
MKTLDTLLIDYINNPEDAEINFALGRYYDELGQSASAVSYYLRCAERTESADLQYECLLHAARCFELQGKRNLTVRGLLQHAIVIRPTRAEAYWMLSRIYEQDASYKDHWMNAYTISSIGMHCCSDSTALRHSVGFPGLFALKFQRALTAWWAGLCDEARTLFEELKHDSSISAEYLQLVLKNINIITSKASNLHEVYNSPTLDAFISNNAFDWGPAARNAWFKNTVEHEIFVENVYQRFVPVKSGDVVVDIGASVGPFAWSIRDSGAARIICVEPHKELFATLQKNVDAECINVAIGNSNGVETNLGLFNESFVETQEADNVALVDTITFKTLIRERNLSKINFLKLDCEGGEYSIFNDENIDWICDNVDYIVGEWHLSNDDLKAKFRVFRDKYLLRFDNVQIFSYDNVDIKHNLHTEWFINYYDTINIYIDNRNKKSKQPPAFASQFKTKKAIKDKWRYSVAPTLEITTIIPEKGCVVDCVFCPQRTLIQNYSGTRRLSLDNFKLAIDKVPTEVRITFAGFTEPWLNSDCTDMLLYAHNRGHPISVFTTMVGVSIEDLERIKHIPFAGAPNGGFTVHLPDQERLAKHPITKKFIETMEYLGSISAEIQNFTVMSMGDTVHESIRHIFSTAPTYAMWSRAGNLTGERMLKPELRDQQFLSIDHGDKQMTCGCDERLYHNIMLPNGDVSLCCMDYGLEEICGNIFESDYNDIIPDPYEIFKLCNKCENAIDVNSRFIRAERASYNV